MKGNFWGTVCIISGAAISYGGWRLIKSQELPPERTGFEGVFINRRGLLFALGYALLGFGMILAIIFGSIFFVGG
jgi:hypothetical protein